jgi:adenine-specific DNA methylase
VLIFNSSRKEAPLSQFLKHLNNQIPGCDGGFEYAYYQFSIHGMQIFLNNLKDVANLNTQSSFLDVGSGRGNTVFCVANKLKPIMSYGIEGDINRYQVLIINKYINNQKINIKIIIIFL